MRKGLSRKEKVLVYLIGVVIGVAILLMVRRGDSDSGEARDSPGAIKGIIQSLIESSGIRNLPEGSPEYLRQSQLFSWHRSQPDASGRFEFIWILQVEEALPWVRVVEQLRVDPANVDAGIQSEGYRLMAADRIILRTLPGTAMDQAKAELEKLSFTLGDRVEGAGGWELKLNQTEVYSVPKAIAILEGEYSWVAGALSYPVPER